MPDSLSAMDVIQQHIKECRDRWGRILALGGAILVAVVGAAAANYFKTGDVQHTEQATATVVEHATSAERQARDAREAREQQILDQLQQLNHSKTIKHGSN